MENILLSAAIPFPPLSWWAMALRAPAVILDKHEHYQKMSYRNRYYLAAPAGRQLLSFPLDRGRNQRQPMKDVRILSSDWSLIHIKTIRALYQRAPFFEHYAPDIFSFFETDEPGLFNRNRRSIELISRLLGLKLELEDSTAYIPEPGPGYTDIRTSYRPQRLCQPGIRYMQVFEERSGFLPDCSILDLLFCEGKMAGLLLREAITCQAT